MDLLIIKGEPFLSGALRRKEMAKIWRSSAEYPVSLDVRIYSQDEVNRWRNERNHILARVLHEGIIVYAQA